MKDCAADGDRQGPWHPLRCEQCTPPNSAALVHVVVRTVWHTSAQNRKRRKAPQLGSHSAPAATRACVASSGGR
eukprot:1677974-Amphidinium_carterae.2